MFDLERILRTLVEHEVRFIVVGGVAAVLQGAPVATQDLDILYDLQPDNVARLHSVLHMLGAVARGDRRQLAFSAAHLATPGAKLSSTVAGDLDLLGSVDGDAPAGILLYEDLLSSTDLFEVSQLPIAVLSLERLIELKRAIGRPKDLAVLPVLEATLRERQR